MAFFDGFVKNKAHADVVRLTAQLNEETARISDLYRKIGELYVSRHEQDCEPVFGEMIRSVNASKARAEELTKQVLFAKGFIKCEKCGCDMPNNVSYCSSCGTALPRIEMPLDNGHVKCEKCGAVLQKGVRFCTACGNNVSEQPVPPAIRPPQSVAFAQPDVPQPPAMLPTNETVCPWCGAKNRDDVPMCTNCGRELHARYEEDGAYPDPKRCAACGAVQEDDVVFCTECGAPL